MESNLRILNFIPDDKFLDTVMFNHDQVEDNVSHYYVLTLNSSVNKESYQFKYIKNKDRVILLYENEIIDFIEEQKINSIILHSLYSIPIHIISKIDSTIPILWVAWGYDIYQIPYHKPLIQVKDLYMPLTLKCQREINRKRKGSFRSLLSVVKGNFIKSGLYTTNQMKLLYKTIERINYFSGIIDLEYRLMRSNPTFKAAESVYAYLPFDVSSSSESSQPKGNNILLGNSGNPTNNHLDLLELLHRRGIIDNTVIVPMNYGAEKEYLDGVKKYGETVLGQKFHQLTDFMDYDSYNEMLGSCSTVIIGTKRQQAIGNISIAIEKGAKIFFYKDSILYQYFKEKGYIVFSVEDDLTNEAVSTPLSNEEINYNFKLHCKLMKEKWNQDALKKIYTQFREKLLS